MKPYELSRNSWHFKLATKVGGFRYRNMWGKEYESLDFCEYLQSILWAFFKIAVALVLFTFLGFCLYDLGLWAYQSIQAGEFLTIQNRLAGFILIVLGVLAAIAATAAIFIGILMLTSKIQTYRETHSTGPGFISLAVDKIRNKTCVQIKFKD